MSSHEPTGLAPGERASRLGHYDIIVEDSAVGAQWFASCICGWVSQLRPLHENAIEDAITHLRAALREWDRTDRPVPTERPELARPELRMAARYPHYGAKRSKPPTPVSRYRRPPAAS
ncbi:hypothetical protein [Intrasporangium sp. YIM S08009]|uniref:hypothetical protein n=1 Tax=Intrasporangium zincisolvens TaxID=3080018 RepID=UPI002B056D82|nr:hypothetical protein [Intrasporangium sp. YIM S08009]